MTAFVGKADWYKDAVFYEVSIRGFYDSNGDGTGDMRGLTEKLDYITSLGVDTIWMLPFYASPLRDGGYDISDFPGIEPGEAVLQVGDPAVVLDQARIILNSDFVQ